MTAPAAAGALAHVCMHATGCLRCSALAVCARPNPHQSSSCIAGLDLSHDQPSGRMKYDEGTGIILFIAGQQVHAYSTSPSATTQQPLWVGASTNTYVVSSKKRLHVFVTAYSAVMIQQRYAAILGQVKLDDLCSTSYQQHLVSIVSVIVNSPMNGLCLHQAQVILFQTLSHMSSISMWSHEYEKLRAQ